LHFLCGRGRCRAQVTVVPVEHPGQGVAEVAQKVPAVRDLDGLGRAAANAVVVSTGAVARDDVDARMVAQPCPDRLRLAARQNVDGAVALQIDDELAAALSSTPSPVVDADDARRRRRRQRRRPDQAQQRVAADRHGQPRRQAGTGLTACAESDAALCLGETGGAPHPRQDHCWQVLGKDAARALGGRAPEAPDLQVELADTALPRQVAEAADVSAVDTARRPPAKGARASRAAGTDGNGDAIRINNQPVDDEAGRKQGQQRLGQGTGGPPSGMACLSCDDRRRPAQPGCTENAEGPVLHVA